MDMSGCACTCRLYGRRLSLFGGSFFCYGDEENARIYAVHLTTANQSKMRRAHLVSVDIGADWVENGRTGENPQPEAEEKQAGWVENGGTGEIPNWKLQRSKRVG